MIWVSSGTCLPTCLHEALHLGKCQAFAARNVHEQVARVLQQQSLIHQRALERALQCILHASGALRGLAEAEEAACVRAAKSGHEIRKAHANHAGLRDHRGDGTHAVTNESDPPG